MEGAMNESEKNVTSYRQLSINEFLDKIKNDQGNKKEIGQILILAEKIVEKRYATNKFLEKAIQYSKSLNW